MSTVNYSVIVPYRDKYDLFVAAVESIPDRDDIQIIIVDNSVVPLSQDRIPEKKSAGITYTTSSTTKGAGCARNVGLKHVKGRFLLFLDADDYFTEDAFDAFDRYVEEDYDIVFFNTTSKRLCDGVISDRHKAYSKIVLDWDKSHNEDMMRYRWPVPWGKLFKSEFVLAGGFQFEEKPVHNDAWFSLITGHAAQRVWGDTSVVYVVTEGNAGQSLVKTVTRENSYIRYCSKISINKFLKTIGRYDMHIRLLGSLRLALKRHGFKELVRYIRTAKENGVGIM